MTLNIAAGQVAVPVGLLQSVLCTSTAVENVTLDPAPASGTNRIDLVVCTARSADWGGANEDFIFTKVNGAQASSPVPPAVPAQSVALAQVYVAGGSAAVTAANITDLRTGTLLVPAGVWTPVTAFNANWSNFGGAYRPCAWRVDTNRRVTLRGVANCSSALNPGTAYAMFTLPSGARPASAEMFQLVSTNISVYGGYGRLDVLASGAVQFTGATNSTLTNGFFSLGGVAFDADGS
jgi:hypothetical protein